jgi:hypothetical protein
MSGQGAISTAELQIREPGKHEPELHGLGEVRLEKLFDAAPWRTFRWYLGQAHCSGTHWSATEASHVIYESRLEIGSWVKARY